VSEKHVVVRKDSYHDSVLLMRISRDLEAREGIEDAVVAMGTPHNLELLTDNGYAGLDGVGPNDMIIAVTGAGLTADGVETAVDDLLAAAQESTATEVRPSTLAGAIAANADANLVLISVPGEHAAREARRALALGRHVMIFSDNVSVEDEVALKEDAVKRGLLMMGPDCGTAIINNKPLAFANVVRSGPIGMVGASGTGVQEVSSCIHKLGSGITQAIGVGGRDLSDAVGGRMTLLGIEALAADEATKVLVVVSKPPSPAVAETVVVALENTGMPCVVHFVGDQPRPARGQVTFADSLAAAAEVACALVGVEVPPVTVDIPAVAADLAAKVKPGAKLRGLFCGGTTGAESLVLLGRAGAEVYSNLHKKGPLSVKGTEDVDGHLLLDLGADEFTQGRPHPMIEPALRNERLEVDMGDDRVGLLLFDVVLGYGSHDDPAGLLVEGVEAARAKRDVVAIASVTGTDFDPQDARAQARKLEAAGIVLMPDNRVASQLAAAVIGRVG